MDSRRRQRSISFSQPHSTTPHPLRVGVPTRLPDALRCRPSAAGGQGATLSTFLQVPLTREPTCTQAIDPGTSGSTLTPTDTSRPSRSSGHFPDFPWSGSPWLANGSALHGDWFPNLTGQLLSILRLPSSPGSQPRDVPFPCGTSRHPSRPSPRVPCLPILLGLLCGPSPTPFSVPSPSPFILCLYPTGPPATLWRGPTGSSCIRGTFLAPSMGRSLPAPVPYPCAGSRHPSRPFPRVPRLPILQGLLCGPSHTPFPVPSPFPIIPCLYPSGPPAALWRGPTGSSSIRGPFHVPSTGRSLPGPFRLGGVLLSGPVGGPSSWPRPRFPRYPCLFPTWSPAVFFSRATRGPSSARLLLPVPPLPAGSVLYALRWCFVVWIVFFGLPPPFPAVHPALWYPPPRMHAHQHCTGHQVSAPLRARLLSHRPPGAWPLAVPGHARWAPLPRVTLLSSLSSLPSHLSLARPLTIALLLHLLSAGLCRARAVARALSRASWPPPCPPSCRPTWAASPGTPSGGLPRRSPPPASPPSVP